MTQAAQVGSYTVRKKFWSFLGVSFHILNAEGDVVGFSRQKAFKLREDIRVFTDESMSEELLLIKARQIVDFSACYDVADAATGETLGSLKRKGFSSFFRDSWLMCTPDGVECATVREDSLLLATVRRWLTNLIPQTFVVESDGVAQAELKQAFNPFILKLTATPEPQCTLDPRMLLAASILLVAIEGRQQG